MIQVEGKDRGRELYKKYPKEITGMCTQRISRYHNSSVYTDLKNYCREMDMYIDGDHTGPADFVSDIVPPTIKRAYHEYSALFHKFLETDPLWSPTKNERMSTEQIAKIQSITNDNLSKTKYRTGCLSHNIDDTIRYGTTATYSFGVNDYNANMLMTIKNDDQYGTIDQIDTEGEIAVVSTPIHPVNVIMDPRTSYQTSYGYIGFIGDLCTSKLRQLEDNPNYIGANIKKLLKQTNSDHLAEEFYIGEDTNLKDYTKGHSNIKYLWTRLPIEGNEDDPSWYAIELIGKYIIRIDKHNLDDGVIPLSVSRILPQKYRWYGGTPLSDKVCVQNMQYWLINQTVENTAKINDRLILHRRGTLDIEAINTRHQTLGFVPVDGNEDLSKLAYGVQMPQQGGRETDWLMQEMRREDQETSMMPNFNPQSQGGPTNKTLGGAQMMASIGEMKASFLVSQFCVGLQEVAKHHLVLMRNLMEKEVETEDGSVVTREDLIGKNITFEIKTSNVFNYIIDGIDSENRIQNLINRRATKIPQFMAIRLKPLIEDAMRNTLKTENISEYVDEELLTELDEHDAEMARKAIAQPPPGLPEGQPPMVPPGGQNVPMA